MDDGLGLITTANYLSLLSCEFNEGKMSNNLTLLRSERPKLYGVLAILSPIGLNPLH